MKSPHNTISEICRQHEVIRRIASEEDINGMQEYLRKLSKWSQDWQMLFNVNKCKCIHFGHNNPKHEYYLDEEIIQATTTERDLGVTVHKSLSVSFQVAKAVKTANKVLGTIRRTITNKTR